MGHEKNLHAGVVSQILAAREKRLWGEIRPVTIGRFSEVGFSDFRLSSGTIYSNKKSEKTDFLENLESDLPFPT